MPILFYECNESKSKKGTIRGLHFQQKFSQGKLIRVTKGAVFDVAVDLRFDSTTFGKWEGFIKVSPSIEVFCIDIAIFVIL